MQNKVLQTTNYKLQTCGGFTLIEILLSTALLGILAASAAPIYHTLYLRNDLELASNAVAQMARRAQSLSHGGRGDSQWGVAIQAGSITLFQGSTYASRNTSYDEISSLPSSIQPSETEFVFQKITGELQAPATITFTSSSGDIKNISINVKGIITY